MQQGVWANSCLRGHAGPPGAGREGGTHLGPHLRGKRGSERWRSSSEPSDGPSCPGSSPGPRGLRASTFKTQGRCPLCPPGERVCVGPWPSFTLGAERSHWGPSETTKENGLWFVDSQRPRTACAERTEPGARATQAPGGQQLRRTGPISKGKQKLDNVRNEGARKSTLGAGVT